MWCFLFLPLPEIWIPSKDSEAIKQLQQRPWILGAITVTMHGLTPLLDEY